MKTTPRDFFLWLAAMASLYVSVISLVALLFEYIDRIFGEPLSYGYYDVYSSGMRMAIASLIIIFPLYVVLTRILNQDIRRNPEKKDFWVRKWAIVLTVFAAGLAMVIDLVVLLNAFLGGQELTTSFLLKVATVLVIGGGVFYYYLQDIRGFWGKREATSKMIGWVVGVLVVAAVIGGFFIMGSPSEQRMLRYDQERVNDLQSLQWQIISYWQGKETLPPNLETLEDPINGMVVPVDPRTGAPYEYRIVNAAGPTFELCATFEAETPQQMPQDASSIRPGPYGNEHWMHGAGRTCFERTIDPDFYPPISKRL